MNKQEALTLSQLRARILNSSLAPAEKLLLLSYLINTIES